MYNKAPTLAVSTPGRVCLFGEHQDYLQLPVVPCAISLRITLRAWRRSDQEIHIELPDIGSHEAFALTGELPYVQERDYFRSVVNVLRRNGFTFAAGLDCEVTGRIPINAGTSSSSALIVSWINLLARMSDQGIALSPDDLARYAHQAEVLEFGEPGGMMDHYATAFGGVIAIDFLPRFSVEVPDVQLQSFVLGDSLEPKDTKGILSRVKNQVLDAVRILKTRDPAFSLATATSATLQVARQDLSDDQRELLEGTVRNRDITAEARALLRSEPLDHRRLGKLLSTHQEVLRDVLRISTPKVDRMLSAAIAAGAYGGKINGSGGGGCMFAYAPENAAAVAAAIEREGGRAYIVSPDAGSRPEPLHPER